MKRKKYREFAAFEKWLDVLLVITIATGLFFLAAEWFFSFNAEIMRLLYSLDLMLVGVIFLDMTRTFLKSKNLFSFMKHHWVDVAVLLVVIVSFSSIVAVGFGRISWLIREEKVAVNLGRASSSGVVKGLRRLFRL